MKRKLSIPVLLMLIVLLLLSGCATPVTDSGQTTTGDSQPVNEVTEPGTETEATAPTAENPPSEEISHLGGTFKIGFSAEPDTLDPHRTSLGVADQIMQLIGGSLVWMTPDLTYEPYLAKSWTISEDGLVWDFVIRDDVKFHDGTPLTARDFAFAYTRALDPETASPATGPMLGAVTSVEAIDDYTLRITLPQPNAPLLFALSDPGYLQPINQAIFERIGEENYGRTPVGVGPYIFKDWLTGDKIVLTRNPDYAWGPDSVQNPGAHYIETLEIYFIPEYATILAGLESGDIHYASVKQQDVDRLEATGDFEIFSILQVGIYPYVSMNVSIPPFDDVRVRQAFNMTVDRNALIQVVAQGKGVVQNGYLSSATMGYWPGVEEIGYTYDLEQAKALLADAGWTDTDGDGILDKDGQPFKISLLLWPEDELTKSAQVLIEQWSDLGIDSEIQQMDIGLMYSKVEAGDYEISMGGMGYGEADLLYLNFHSSMIGSLNVSVLDDPEMDAMLEQSRTETDQDARQEVLNQIQRIISEQAYVIPLYTPMGFSVVNKQWKGVVYNKSQVALDLSGAYLEP